MVALVSVFCYSRGGEGLRSLLALCYVTCECFKKARRGLFTKSSWPYDKLDFRLAI